MVKFLQGQTTHLKSTSAVPWWAKSLVCMAAPTRMIKETTGELVQLKKAHNSRDATRITCWETCVKYFVKHQLKPNLMAHNKVNNHFQLPTVKSWFFFFGKRKNKFLQTNFIDHPTFSSVLCSVSLINCLVRTKCWLKFVSEFWFEKLKQLRSFVIVVYGFVLGKQ